ncbi:RNA ligase family protein, partial [Streptomyces sp. NPDC048669]|uniref:RNA ligase family protein n=1 Tax=Streptomyces sp. NPDC048669 TaxID=3155267 RepID=UPI003420327F
MRTHYPRTPHLPWSPGAASDDVRLADLAGLTGTEVVVTEKLDGENTTLYADGLHARSLDSAHHPSRARVKALQGRVGPRIPAGRRICGENVFARHSIPYEDLAGHFYGFSVWDGDLCLGWDRTVAFLRDLGIPTPPVLWRGVFDARAQRTLRALRPDTGRQEGYVVRPAEAFPAAAFGRRVAKWVRPGHVRTDTHWMHAAVVENGLGPSAALWDVRSGAPVDPAALATAVGTAPGDAPAALATADELDGLSLTGDDRLTGVLAALLHRTRRAALAPALAAPLGIPAASRTSGLSFGSGWIRERGPVPCIARRRREPWRSHGAPTTARPVGVERVPVGGVLG